MNVWCEKIDEIQAPNAFEAEIEGAETETMVEHRNTSEADFVKCVESNTVDENINTSETYLKLLQEPFMEKAKDSRSEDLAVVIVFAFDRKFILITTETLANLLIGATYISASFKGDSLAGMSATGEGWSPRAFISSIWLLDPPRLGVELTGPWTDCS